MGKIYLPSFNLELFPLTVTDKSLMKLMGRRWWSMLFLAYSLWVMPPYRFCHLSWYMWLLSFLPDLARKLASWEFVFVTSRILIFLWHTCSCRASKKNVRWQKQAAKFKAQFSRSLQNLAAAIRRDAHFAYFSTKLSQVYPHATSFVRK